MNSMFSLKTALRTLLIAVVVMTTASCGFHMRGTYLLPDDVNEMSLTSYDQYSRFTREVQKQLRMNGLVEVPPSSNTPNLHLISEGVAERTLSLYQNSRAAEKELTFSANFRVVIPNKESRVFTTTVTRSYLDNPKTALAKSVERDMIEDEMREQASRQILRQMARLKASGVVDNPISDLDQAPSN